MNEGKPAGNKTRDWIIRIVIFGALGVVLVLALLDYQAKTQATETGEAWRNLLTESNEGGDSELPLDTLKDSMKGSPEVSETKGQNVYTWKGQFREYAITVSYDARFPEKPITSIEGPGESAEE